MSALDELLYAADANGGIVDGVGYVPEYVWQRVVTKRGGFFGGAAVIMRRVVVPEAAPVWMAEDTPLSAFRQAYTMETINIYPERYRPAVAWMYVPEGL